MATTARAINAQGEIAGTCVNASRDTQPCFWAGDGMMREIGLVAGCLNGFATGLNDIGQVVGYCERFNNAPAFIWSLDQGLTELPTPDGTDAWVIRPAAINNNGAIVGWMRSADASDGQGFVYADGTYRLFGPSTAAWDISDNGDAVGRKFSQAIMWDDAGEHPLPSFDPSDFNGAFSINEGSVIAGFAGLHAAAWTADGIVDLGTVCPNPDQGGFASATAVAHAIIVGWSNCPSYPAYAQYHAFVFDLNGPGYGFDLNALVAPSDANLEAAYGVNGNGQIVGNLIRSDGRHGFLLTPVPSLAQP